MFVLSFVHSFFFLAAKLIGRSKGGQYFKNIDFLEVLLLKMEGREVERTFRRKDDTDILVMIKSTDTKTGSRSSTVST